MSAPSSLSTRDYDDYPAPNTAYPPSPAATASQAVVEPAPQPTAAAVGPASPQPAAAISSPYELAPSQRWGSTRVLGQHSFLLGT
ncbi:MAG TPA: hypothetical protein VFN67_21550, partial [Polyangiales bacterium]|nr:hypothetical protein [Polyangiales bacterium]